MEIVFQTKELRELCQSQEEAEKALQPNLSKSLRNCLADMRAAANVSELMTLRNLSTDGKTLTIPLSCGKVVTVRQSHLHPPKTDGSLDWSKVYRVRILSIGARDA